MIGSTSDNKKIRPLLLLLLWLIPYSPQASPRDTLTIHTMDDLSEAGRYYHLFKTDHPIRPSSVINLYNSASTLKDLNGGYSETIHVLPYYWLWITLNNASGTDINACFQFNSQVIDTIYGYKVTAGKQEVYLGKSGTDVPFSQRAYSGYDIVYPSVLKNKESTTFLFVIKNTTGDGLHFLPQVVPSSVFREKEEYFYIASGVLSGLMVTIALLNVFLWIVLQEKLNLWYALYVVVALYEIWSMRGIDIQFIYPEHAYLSGMLQDLSPCILAILMTKIMQLFLNQKRDNSWLKSFADYGLVAIIILAVANPIALFLFPQLRGLAGWLESLLAVALLYQCIILLLSGIEKIIQGYRPGIFYVCAVVVFIIGLIAYIQFVLWGMYHRAIVEKYPNSLEMGIVIESLIVFLGIVYRYNSYKRDKQRLTNELHMQKQNLLERIIAAEETERKRIAEDLHDDVGGTLSALSMHLSNIIPEDEDVSFGPQEYALKLTNKAFNDIRNIAHNLLPKDFVDMGLFRVVQFKVAALNQTGNIRFDLVTEGDDSQLQVLTAITVYRIVSELITNILKHSVASEATVQISIVNNQLQVIVEDNGVGISDIEHKGIGLKNISNRIEYLNGKLHIDSSRNGTQTIIEIDLNPLP